MRGRKDGRGQVSCILRGQEDRVGAGTRTPDLEEILHMRFVLEEGTGRDGRVCWP